jgi:hypothetical protein
MTSTRITRRSVVQSAALTGAGALFGLNRAVAASPPVEPKWIGPATAPHLRSGPLGLGPAPVARKPGVRPVELRMDKFGIDAPVEVLQIVDGVMQNPSGPWVVGWYEQIGSLDQFSNVVFCGHVDYYTVGPAVFWSITNGDVQEGDEILALADDGSTFTYAVKLRETLEVASLTSEKIVEIVGPTKRESITLITCGGEFDYSTGEYLSRTWLRADRTTS